MSPGERGGDQHPEQQQQREGKGAHIRDKITNTEEQGRRERTQAAGSRRGPVCPENAATADWG